MASEAGRTAILIIDMQNDFCSREGAMAGLGFDTSRNLVVAGRLPAFVEAAGDLGALVVWVRQAGREELVSPARRERARAMNRGTMEVAAAGSWGADLAEGLSPQPGEPVVDKTRYSAFVGTPLHNLLRAQGRDRLVVCGTAANVCVDSTIRDAYMADYTVTMASDLVGWTMPELAASAMKNLQFYFCDVEDSASILSRWAR